MKARLFRVSLYSVAAVILAAPWCPAQDLRPLASTISQHISASGRRTVAVVDFTDLDGNPTKLGRFLAEEFSDALFSEASNFDVIDRTHLKMLLQEHKLATTGLIDPATAQELGRIAGVQTLVTGTITPFEESVHLSVKVLDTESAKIIAASTADIAKTKTISDLIATESSAGSQVPSGESRQPTPQPPMPAPVMRDDLSFLVRGCVLAATTLRCTFGVTNKASSTRRVWFTDAFFVDDQGRQFNRPGLDFASKTSWMDHTTDLIPDVPVNLTLEVANFPNSANIVNAQISYGAQVHEGQYYGPTSDFGKIAITKIPVTR